MKHPNLAPGPADLAGDPPDGPTCNACQDAGYLTPDPDADPVMCPACPRCSGCGGRAVVGDHRRCWMIE